MFITRRLNALSCAALVVMVSACAVPVSSGFEMPRSKISVPVRVTNDSPELVHVWFVSGAGKVRVGTVTPHTQAAFSTLISRNTAGRFYVHRLSESGGTALNGEVEPFFLEQRAVVLHVGAQSAFDYWQLR